MDNKENINVIPDFKMYITDLKTGKQSKEIDVFDLIYKDYIEFEFGSYEDKDYSTLPYKDFKFFINDYSVTIYSPQLNKRIDKAVEYNQKIMDNYLKEDDCEYCDGRYSVAKKNINILKGGDTNE